MSADYPNEVTLTGAKGPLRIVLTVPKSLALRNEVTYAIGDSEPRAFGAALGLCSSVIQRHVPWRNQPILAYGQLVMDWLLSEGVPYHDAYGAGDLAWAHISEGLIPRSRVQEAEDFTGAGGRTTS